MYDIRYLPVAKTDLEKITRYIVRELKNQRPPAICGTRWTKAYGVCANSRFPALNINPPDRSAVNTGCCL